uniref:Uncharacterized protein n=1 Tax=Moniliophthora roreri TaxID=221103 RepID=A0A0W0F4V4_MONRR
MFKVHSSSS